MMIIRSFPDFSLRDHNIDGPCPEVGWPNAVLLTSNRKLHYPEHSGPLAIMCNFGGRGEYLIPRNRFVVDDSSYVVLNHGQRFSNIIDAGHDVESLHLWFEPGFAEGVLRDLTTPHDILLDDPGRAPGNPITFFEKTYPHDDIVSPLLLAIRRAVREGSCTTGWLEDRFHAMLERLLHVHRGVGSTIERLPAVRRSTRLELYRKLHMAKDFIDANIELPLTLARIAREACLSTHHFLRLFKEAFGITPHQYLTTRRIDRARHLLVATDLPIGQVCSAVGFTSAGSFSLLFRRRTGLSPEGFRERARRNQV
jgi:AraC-like DNA-binding protein